MAPEGPERARAAIACQTCRRRKVKCTGGDPCKNCSKAGLECTYISPQRRKRAKIASATLLNLGEEASHSTLRDERRHSVRDFDQLVNTTHYDGHHEDNILASTRNDRGVLTQQTSSSQTPPWLVGVQHATNPRPLSPDSQSFGVRVVERRSVSNPLDLNCSTTPDTTKSSNRVLGSVTDKLQDLPGWMSACSQAGVTWVCGTAGNHTFAGIAERFVHNMSRPSCHNSNLNFTTKIPEPSEACAWEYVNAFFENCWESHLGLVHQSDFEAQLHAHFHNETSAGNQFAEIALRNVVFAFGYRSILAKTDASSSIAQQLRVCQNYFENALSMLSELLLLPPTPMTVQALALMACYTEVVEGPEIQRVLCYNAVHAAVSQGLHRQQHHSREASSDEKARAAWLWWAVYALEKRFALFSGNSSMIDDDTISIPIPSVAPCDRSSDLKALQLAARLAKIWSRLLQKLTSRKAHTTTSNDLRMLVTDLDKQLQDLLKETPPKLRLGTLSKLSDEIKPASRHLYALYLHFSIHGSILAVHSHIFYPWLLQPRLQNDPDESLLTQIALSSESVAQASRSMLLAIRTVTPNVATPIWLAVMYPIYAHLSLLVYILKNPTSPTVNADLGLLDVCGGHFGYIDFLTSSAVSISLPRESVNLAAKVVKIAKATAENTGPCTPSTSSLPTLRDPTLDPGFQQAKLKAFQRLFYVTQPIA